ncbi:tyrosine-type recombinase/integrase [Synechococcus sp. RSCCF101]|uniref:tyrosine-type recombinase/integrase n=1 Tax=Synechococcus sp. RSCCF101 TaxID=2511069 RepID=UPI001CD9E294|nr:tyrosine-type recombinase/integrase [Synechococcus sp. RSCCF101]
MREIYCGVGRIRFIVSSTAQSGRLRTLIHPGPVSGVHVTLTDQQILELLDALPRDSAGERWRYAIRLLAVYGLRPEELRHLCIKEGTHGPELWTTYRKSKGGRKGERTEPRRLHALLLRDSSVDPVYWNLQDCVALGAALPALGKEGKGGEAVGTYLRRQDCWNNLRTQAEQQAEQLTPYAFRHRYAKRSHALGLPIANIAQAMGHTIEVHLHSYARFTPDATADLYERANDRPQNS